MLDRKPAERFVERYAGLKIVEQRPLKVLAEPRPFPERQLHMRADFPEKRGDRFRLPRGQRADIPVKRPLVLCPSLLFHARRPPGVLRFGGVFASHFAAKRRKQRCGTAVIRLF